MSKSAFYRGKTLSQEFKDWVLSLPREHKLDMLQTLHEKKDGMFFDLLHLLCGVCTKYGGIEHEDVMQYIANNNEKQ